MTREFLRLATGVAGIALALGAGVASAQTADPAALHARVLTLDGHADVLLPSTPARYYTADGGSRVDLDQLTRGGVDAIVLSVAVGPGARDAEGLRAARAEADAKLEAIKAFAAASPQRIGIALGAADVVRLNREGKVAVIIGFQNARSIGDDLTQIDRLYGEGIRVFGFNHAGNNAFSDSSRPGDAQPAAEHGGLSAVGRQAVTKLNDLGVLIDVSQLSSQALSQTLELTRVPVAATHSDARALVDNTRNLTDAELDAIGRNGGVVQVVPFNAYLAKPASRERITALRAEYGLSAEFAVANDGAVGLAQPRQQAFLDALAELTPKATLSDYVDHIAYIGERIGWDHVGIGTDFNHGSGVPGFDSAADAPNVTREFVRRGYDEARISAIWSGNFLRVLQAAEAGRKS